MKTRLDEFIKKTEEINSNDLKNHLSQDCVYQGYDHRDNTLYFTIYGCCPECNDVLIVNVNDLNFNLDLSVFNL